MKPQYVPRGGRRFEGSDDESPAEEAEGEQTPPWEAYAPAASQRRGEVVPHCGLFLQRSMRDRQGTVMLREPRPHWLSDMDAASHYCRERRMREEDQLSDIEQEERGNAEAGIGGAEE